MNVVVKLHRQIVTVPLSTIATWNKKKNGTPSFDPKNQDFLKAFAAGEFDHRQMVQWKYRRYMRNYLSTVKAVDDGVGRLLDYLDDHGLAENALVIIPPTKVFI